MRCPTGLNAAGKRAFARAVAQAPDAEAVVEAIERYARLVDLADELRREWIREGRPGLTLGGATGQAPVPHPLPRMIREAERDAIVAWGEVVPAVKRAPGRPKASTSAPDRPSTAVEPARLRAVK